ncbi:hypothetical protein JZ751_001518, partial [Albula glossodonta]
MPLLWKSGRLRNPPITSDITCSEHLLSGQGLRLPAGNIHNAGPSRPRCVTCVYCLERPARKCCAVAMGMAAHLYGTLLLAVLLLYLHLQTLPPGTPNTHCRQAALAPLSHRPPLSTNGLSRRGGEWFSQGRLASHQSMMQLSAIQIDSMQSHLSLQTGGIEATAAALCLLRTSQGAESLVRARVGGTAELGCSLTPPSSGATTPHLFPLHVVEWVRLGYSVPILIKFGVYTPRVHPNYK